MNKHNKKPLRLDRTTIRSLTTRELSSAAGALRTNIFTDPKSNEIIGCPPPNSFPKACLSILDDCTIGTMGCPIGSFGC